MGLGNETREFFEEHWLKYSNDRKKLSDDFKEITERATRWLIKAAYQPYKWLFIVPFLVLSTFVFGTLAIIASLFISPPVGRIFAVMWARTNSFITPMTVTVVGAENMEPGVSYVITANHQSFYDIYALYGWMGRDFKWVMKKELERVPILGLACKALGHIFIDRSDTKSAVETINAAKARITNGTSVLFFPEGSRSSEGNIGPFKKGAFKMAMDLDIPILPVTLNGTRNILPKGSMDLMPGAVTLVIHKPISVRNYHEKNIKKLMDKTWFSIISSLE